MAATQGRVPLPTQDGLLYEAQEIFLAFVAARPVDPRDLVVLRVGIVVSPLRTRDLVPMGDHRRALREGERREHALHHAIARVEDFLIIGRSLRTPVPAEV